MVTIGLAGISLAFLFAEFWLGIAVTGWTGDELYVERKKAPGPYYAWMTLHVIVGVGMPILTWFAGM